MENNLNKISDLINNQNDLSNEKEFKIASASLVCSVINITQSDSTKYCPLFKKRLNIEESEFEQIKNEISNDALNIEDKVIYIKNALNNNMFQIMEFLKILNRFAIINGCTAKSYREFELTRDKFLREFY